MKILLSSGKLVDSMEETVTRSDPGHRCVQIERPRRCMSSVGARKYFWLADTSFRQSPGAASYVLRGFK